ncbi:MAG: hypothetical protein AAGI52_15870 [Bacteroidota bacterium]
MKQTLLAICGLGIAMLLAVSSQERTLQATSSATESTIETLAGQAATNVLGYIAAQPFDANTAANLVTDDPTALTPASLFPTGRAFGAATDVDDFHQMATHTYASGMPGITFEVDAEVRYVNEAAQPSATSTFNKEVIVTVRHAQLRTPITLRRVVSWL